MIETFTRAKTAAWARENAAGWDLREPSVVVSTVNRETWKRNVSSRSTEASKVKKREREIIIIKKDKRNSRFRVKILNLQIREKEKLLSNDFESSRKRERVIEPDYSYLSFAAI